jgi:membrane associated rhomboid family serine protease
MDAVRRVPVVTVVAVGVAVVAAVVQYAAPAVVPLLQRDQGALESGQWWRLVTPLFVQTLGWYQVVTNLVTLAAVGAVAEWRLGRARWAVLFAAGTAGGQLAAYAWHEPGGGASIAICGLAGGVVAWWLAGRADAERWELGIVVCYLAALTGWGFGGLAAAAIAAVTAAAATGAATTTAAGAATAAATATTATATAAATAHAAARGTYATTARRATLLGAVGCTLALTAAGDLHGVSLLSGMITGLVLTGGLRARPGSGPARS